MRTAFEIQKAAVFALFLREMRTRFGKYRLGYLWAPLEPTAHVLILVTVFSLFGNRNAPGMPFSVFFIAGIVPWFLFSHIAIRSLKAVEANVGLFNYRPVRPIDTVLARALLELIIYSCVFAALLIAVRILGQQIQIENFLLLVTAFFLLGLFAFGIGLIFMVMGDAFPETEKMIPVAIQPLYFVSGIFFSVEHLPAEYRPFMLWNPIIHAIELGRNALSTTYEVNDASLLYLFISALGSTVVGLLIYRAREGEMLTT
jgi:capsular polysaccharide transport system permease protein